MIVLATPAKALEAGTIAEFPLQASTQGGVVLNPRRRGRKCPVHQRNTVAFDHSFSPRAHVKPSVRARRDDCIRHISTPDLPTRVFGVAQKAASVGRRGFRL